MSCCSSKDSNPATGGSSTIQDVKEYYGKTLETKKDLKTNACTLGNTKMPKHIREALAMVHDVITSKYYGCGLVVPECLEGMSVLDLGSGSGQDCYVLSKLVGQEGTITGIDMTEEQLAVSREYIDYHMKKFGYSKPNVNFVHGYIEKLGEAGLKDNTFDIIISNCVVNLSPDKRAVLREAYRVLKSGGEFYFSDVYADSDLPDHIRKHKQLWGECIAGALYWRDLVKLAKDLGFCTPRLVSATTISIGNKELQEVVGDAKFVSACYRLFKVADADKSPVAKATYNGTVTTFPESIPFDLKTTFQKGQPMVVDAELASILKASRFNKHFTLEPTSDPPATKPLELEDVNPYKSAKSGGGCCSSSKSCCS